MEEMEEKLQENVPLADELQKELEETSTNYTKQKEMYNGMCMDCRMSSCVIHQSTKKCKKEKRIHL